MKNASMPSAKTYLTFRLDREIFAVDVTKVQEVLDYTTITRVPQTPLFMSGVINLRGSVIPVIDLRLKLNMSETQRTMDTCIVVLEIALEEDRLVLGALADAVLEVFELDSEYIDSPPQIGVHYRSEFLKGMTRRDEKFIMILDVDRIFSYEELSVVQASNTVRTEKEPEAAEVPEDQPEIAEKGANK